MHVPFHITFLVKDCLYIAKGVQPQITLSVSLYMEVEGEACLSLKHTFGKFSNERRRVEKEEADSSTI